MRILSRVFRGLLLAAILVFAGISPSFAGKGEECYYTNPFTGECYSDVDAWLLALTANGCSPAAGYIDTEGKIMCCPEDPNITPNAETGFCECADGRFNPITKSCDKLLIARSRWCDIWGKGYFFNYLDKFLNQSGLAAYRSKYTCSQVMEAIPNGSNLLTWADPEGCTCTCADSALTFNPGAAIDCMDNGNGCENVCVDLNTGTAEAACPLGQRYYYIEGQWQCCIFYDPETPRCIKNNEDWLSYIRSLGFSGGYVNSEGLPVECPSGNGVYVNQSTGRCMCEGGGWFDTTTGSCLSSLWIWLKKVTSSGGQGHDSRTVYRSQSPNTAPTAQATTDGFFDPANHIVYKSDGSFGYTSLSGSTPFTTTTDYVVTTPSTVYQAFVEAWRYITLTFRKNDGTNNAQVTRHRVAGGVNANTPAITNPSRAGYTFNGWYTAASGGAPVSMNPITATSDTTYYAHWTANTYTVTLNKNANDATAGTTSVTATYGSNMPSATMPTRNGYNFLGYYDTNAATGGTQYYTAAGASARTWNKSQNATLYARWEQVAQTITVTYDSQGGSACSPSSFSHTVGTTSTLTCTPTKSNVAFAGWWTLASGGTKVTQVPASQSSSVTYYAHWVTQTNLDSSTRGGSGGPAAIYVDNNSCKVYSDSALGTEITALQNNQYPSKTNATYIGYYDGNEKLIDPSQTDHFTTLKQKCQLGTLYSTVYAHYNCNTNWQGSGIDITGTCTSTPRCFRVDFDNTTNGGSGGTQNIWLYRNDDNLNDSKNCKIYSDSSCTTQINSITIPTKANASYAGQYSTTGIHANYSDYDEGFFALNGVSQVAMGWNYCATASNTSSYFSALNNTYGFDVSSTPSMTLRAIYNCNDGYHDDNGTCVLNTYTVSFDANGGNGSYTLHKSCTHGELCTLQVWNNDFPNPCNITNGNKIFLGWSTDPNAVVAEYTDSGYFYGDTTLYAVWGDTGCDITHGSGSATTPTNNTPRCVVTCDNGFHTSGTYSGTAGDTTVSYACSGDTYTITLKLEGGHNTNNVNATEDIVFYEVYGSHYENTSNNTITSIPSVEKSGYSFAGYYTAASGGDLVLSSTTLPSADTFTADTILYAHWSQDSVPCGEGYYLPANSTGAGDCTICPAGYWCPGGNYSLSSSSIQGRNACPARQSNDLGDSNTVATSDTGTAAVTGCYISWLPEGCAASVASGWTFSTFTLNTTKTSENPRVYALNDGTNNQDAYPTASQYIRPGKLYSLPGYAVVEDNTYMGDTYISSGYPGATKDLYGIIGKSCTACTGNTYAQGGGQIKWQSGSISKNGIGICTSCPSGLLTSGSPVAYHDEAADCGRVLHVGAYTLHLRSGKKTTPSLNFDYGGTRLYANMTTTQSNMSTLQNPSKKFKMRYNNTVYYVCDDSTCN